MGAPVVPDAPYTFDTSPSPEPAPAPLPPAAHVGPGRPRGSGAKRGRKPRGAALSGVASPRATSTDAVTTNTSSPAFPSSYAPHVHWDVNSLSTPGASGSSSLLSGPSIAASRPSITTGVSAYGQTLHVTTSSGTPLNMAGLFRMSESLAATGSSAFPRVPGIGAEDEGEGDDELLPAMADDDYSAQLSWQSQSKDNLKVLMENFSPDQYERFEAYRRHALPKQAVRKVIQQINGQQVSQPVAQIVAGFAKVFVGEIVEKARQVQARRGETGPLSPDHLREAYRMYQQETGNVGAARPVRSKRLFVR
ncbi:hTAFII28-like protein conserved region-domain-containing protein [Rhodocollybia butyracea]|uniref:Transcription initiation factor TFIID subunit 11 n=1 Tax=Rhodocollybia butyracea TaxID=206335 RepID=A0A9P5UA16_9AGAR|nr:hTAFII28-like protein conserved region-domain-containing protein [Rhodocollybia butyracea]